MFIDNISDEDILESLFLAKHRNKKSYVKVGRDHRDYDYFYLGKNVFLKKKDDSSTDFYLMELPVSSERTGNVPYVEVIPDSGLIKFCAPLCSGFQVVIAEAVWEGFELGWNIVNNVGNSIKENSSLSSVFSDLDNTKLYGSKNDKYSESLRNIIENVVALEKEKNESLVLSKKRKK